MQIHEESSYDAPLELSVGFVYVSPSKDPMLPVSCLARFTKLRFEKPDNLDLETFPFLEAQEQTAYFTALLPELFDVLRTMLVELCDAPDGRVAYVYVYEGIFKGMASASKTVAKGHHAIEKFVINFQEDMQSLNQPRVIH